MTIHSICTILLLLLVAGVVDSVVIFLIIGYLVLELSWILFDAGRFWERKRIWIKMLFLLAGLDGIALGYYFPKSVDVEDGNIVLFLIFIFSFVLFLVSIGVELYCKSRDSQRTAATNSDE